MNWIDRWNPLGLVAAGMIVSTADARAQSAAFQVVSPPVAVTAAGVEATAPAVSPDGRTVAFSGPGYANLWLVSSAGGAATKLADGAGIGWGASWSPTGAYLAVRATRTEADGRRSSALVVLDPATGASSKPESWAPALGFGLPIWAGDGQLVAQTGDPATARASSPTRLDNPLATGNASPTVARFVQPTVPGSADDALVLQAADGSVRTLQPTPGRYIQAVWSPDGSKVALRVLSPTGGGTLSVFTSDGRRMAGFGADAVAPTWVGSDRLVFVREREDATGHAVVSADLYGARADGSGETALTRSTDRLESDPSASADGTVVYAATDADGRSRIYRLQVR